MKRVIAYIDGFNFYAGLTEYSKNNPTLLPHNKVDLRALVEQCLLHEGETLTATRWYSAIPPDNHRDPEYQAKINRHYQYRRALEATGVNVRISGFKKRPIRCQHCGKVTKHRQEKESDKRCSLEMLEDAFYGRMDRALLLSSDSDFVPVLHSLKRYSEQRPVDVVMCPPPGREASAKTVVNACKELFGITPRYTYRSHLKKSLFKQP